jgi:hypothetical protein
VADSTEPSTSGTLLGARAALLLGGALLVGLAGVVAFSMRDAARETSLETFTQDTAVGDHVLYRPPNPPHAVPEPILTWEGRALAPASYDKVKINDGQMRRVGRDETTGLSLYRPRAAGGGGELHVKIAQGEYLRLRTP